MSMETLEFVIHPDGRVEEKVTGVVGASCSDVTAAIEVKLGEVVSFEPTSDYYAQPATQSARTTEADTNPVRFSDW
ncbi:MAG: hypothetical protein BRC58_03510 [Cyanobacteria bacterium QS_8_64_29]|nr:MAG: hypothetical protein BRC58_03510 [Cyanobacteria bacterium QS_8_64_29]